MCLHRRLSGSRIAELGAGGFLRCKGGVRVEISARSFSASAA
jgi:hypothetical protein